MVRRMKLYYAITKNFGDGMNRILFRSLLDSPFSETRVTYNTPSDSTDHEKELCIFGSGSILGFMRQNKDHDVVCGSGFISDTIQVVPPSRILSVRGPLTRQRYLDAGIPCPPRYGDLGLLLSRILPAPVVPKRFAIGLIPHYEDAGLPLVKRLAALEGWTVIDINQTDTPEKFVKELNECELILSSSLHGIIVADSYGIPAHHVVLSNNVWGNGFKFRDYYASVGRDYFSVDLSSMNTEVIKTACTPYTLRFDIDEYYAYLKKSLNSLCVNPVVTTMNTLDAVKPWPSVPTEPPVIRLHMPAIPHTITHIDYSHCAFTGKVLRFAPMMRSRGFEVYHYGVEGSEPDASSNIQLMTKAEWADLRLASAKQVFPKKTEAELKAQLADPTAFVGNLANYDTVLYKEFNRRFRTALQANYRSEKTDIVCLPLYPYEAVNGLPYVVVESGIGYPNSAHNYRIFESNAWMHAHTGKANGQNYWFVVPNYFDSRQWPLSLTPKVDTVGFLGRIYDGKGCGEIVEMARRMPSVRFILCGQGDPSRYLKTANLFYKPPIHGEERAEYLGSLVALIAPTTFVEPFCGVAVEAQLCGTPVITKDYGAQTETVEQFKTGLRCHTLADSCLGITMALEGKFDRTYIRERAVRLYDMFNVARQYEYTFKTLMDVHNGKNGWYSPDSHIECRKEE